MKIGILVLAVGNFGKLGLYNAQEVGLGKALTAMGHDVTVYKCIHDDADTGTFNESGMTISCVKTRKIGNNSMFRCEALDKMMDVLVCFSDIQLSLPTVRRWADKNKVLFIPYIGVIESTSPNKYVRIVIDCLSKRVFNAYKGLKLLAKTSSVVSRLNSKGLTDVVVAPVGIDTDLLYKDYAKANVSEMKLKYGFSDSDNVYLLVGRLEENRNSMDCIPVFKAIAQKDNNARLLVVGKGYLENKFFSRLEELGLKDKVKHLPQIPNSQMWEVYRMATALLTFNRVEIFGMSILEAMYYETTVYAINAPGPNDIIEHGVSGYLYKDVPSMIAALDKDVPTKSIVYQAHQRILENFTWKTTAKIINDYAESRL